MKYNAFISYRHAELDMEIAKKIHKGLETFHIPQLVRERYGKRKIERVFRDQEELPIGSDLDDNIRSALSESEFLIVICSPRTPESYWVCKEIDTFIELHDREHVLAILVEGEPNESFPPQLLTDEMGRSVEPLAADVRGATVGERNKKLKTELIRLAAPLIGCSYDELRQRNRERILRRNMTAAGFIALTVAFIGLVFGAYNARVAAQMTQLAEDKVRLAEKTSQLAAEKTKLADDIMEEYQQKLINQSRFYASEAISTLENGDRRAAALIAREGLPSEDNERPYVADAEYALSSVLHAYDDGSILDFDRILNHDTNIKECHMNKDWNRLISIDLALNVYVWDSSDWSLLAKIPPGRNENNDISNVLDAYADDQYIYVVAADSFRKYDYDGILLYTIRCRDIWSAVIDEEEGLVYITESDHIKILQLSDGESVSSFENPLSVSFNDKSQYDKERGLYINGHCDPDEGNAVISILNVKEEKYTDVTLSSSHLFRYCICEDGNIAALSGNNDFLTEGLNEMMLDLILPDGQTLWTVKLDIGKLNTSDLFTNVRSHSFMQAGEKKDRIVVAFKDLIFCLDEADGSCLMNNSNLSGNVSKLLLNSSDPGGFVVFDNGSLELMNFDTGKIYPDSSLQFNISIMDMISGKGYVVIRSRTNHDLYVLSYMKAPDLEELPELSDDMFYEGISPEGDYYVLHESMDIFNFFNTEAEQIYSFTPEENYILKSAFCGSLFVAAGNENIYYIDPQKQKTEKLPYSKLGSDPRVSKVTFSHNDSYAVLWFGSTLSLFDVKEKEIVFSFEPDSIPDYAMASEDGKWIYVSEDDKKVYSVNSENGNVKEYKTDDLIMKVIVSSHDFFDLSPDGSLLAVACADQNIRIIKTNDGTLVACLPMAYNSRFFMQFSEDGRFLYYQSENREFHIWNIKENKLDAAFVTNAVIIYKTVNEKDGKIAFGNGYSLYILDSETNALASFVPHGIVYLQKNNSFILNDAEKLKTKVYRTYYKDYHNLIEEMAKQFPDSELSEKEKLKYNIQ